MRNPLVSVYSRFGLKEVLDRFSGLSIKPSRSSDLVLCGSLGFSASTAGYGSAEDCFQIEIRVPMSFPAVLPTVRELAGRIPATFHKLHDGSLCLGSPFQVRFKLRAAPTLSRYIKRCLIPYLLGFALFERTGKMPFGELEHGVRGLLDEYREITGANSDRACISFLLLAGKRKRIANKLACPCGSGRRLGRCHNRMLNRLRNNASRSWYRGSVEYLERMLQPSAQVD
jgi:hypothetical protein